MPRFEEGKAKIPGTAEIVQAVIAQLTQERDLEGKKVLITAGPTRAYLDAFRYLTNPSSGKMGTALAQNAFDRGAEVTMVYGPGTAKPPTGVKVIPVLTTEDMLEAVKNELTTAKYDAAILCAAFTPDSQGG